MTGEQNDRGIPEDEKAVIGTLREGEDEEPTEEETNLAIAQARLIGDI